MCVAFHDLIVGQYSLSIVRTVLTHVEFEILYLFLWRVCRIFFVFVFLIRSKFTRAYVDISRPARHGKVT
jgi:hypothetical protein